MAEQHTAPDDQRGPVRPRDPLAKRITNCAIWLVGYALVWGLGIWRPLPQVAWVNLAILGAIPIATLPPAAIRPFTSGVAFLALAAIMWFVMHAPILAVVLGITGVLALSDGIFDVRGQRRS